ncbi:SRPBCC family protein [Oceanihabitans sp. IOP_32]|uniref:SRPBCC family protein n=1 Tax=Oceanihabitans sp. IOP_32 TaxID=2529032 RepID=UPI002107D969|nr:SRPBCC domain-containing protein [Oceanihabitans sp. IOP_32]
MEQVCNPITKAEEISTWFIPNDFKAEPRYQYTFTSPPNEKGCTVTSGKAKKAHTYILIYTWIVGDTKVETIVKWELEATQNGTKLSLEHSNIYNYACETAVARFESFNGGWDNCISSSTSY